MIDVNVLLFGACVLVAFVALLGSCALWARTEYRHQERMKQMEYDHERDMAAWKAGEVEK